MIYRAGDDREVAAVLEKWTKQGIKLDELLAVMTKEESMSKAYAADQRFPRIVDTRTAAEAFNESGHVIETLRVRIAELESRNASLKQTVGELQEAVSELVSGGAA